VPGHWEGDPLIMGGTATGSAIGTLVERFTRFTILLHLPGRHDSRRRARQVPEVQTALDLKLYFCDPHSPWQRGTNENTNRLLRHWFEKGSDLRSIPPRTLRGSRPPSTHDHDPPRICRPPLRD
jgi:IS30 family transposase